MYEYRKPVIFKNSNFWEYLRDFISKIRASPQELCC
jgi:hypothetical protein